MAPTSVHDRATEVRRATRASIYLAAALCRDGCSIPVKIRNMSSTGALLEGAALPSAGALVQLVRGCLIVHGLVAWSVDSRCGVKFSGCVDVQQWRAAPANNEQQGDQTVRQVKASPAPAAHSQHLQGAQPGNGAGADLSEDLRRASRLLESLGGILAGDPEIVMHHGPALQNLDIAMQAIAAVEAIMAGRSDLEIDGIKLLALRRSADWALQHLS